jgi:hypothetical protein
MGSEVDLTARALGLAVERHVRGRTFFRNFSIECRVTVLEIRFWLLNVPAERCRLHSRGYTHSMTVKHDR